MKRIVIVTLLLALCLSQLYAQTYSPVQVTGFNQDVVADTGTNATAVTSTELDLVFNVLYSTTFAATNNLAGGIPDNGIISNGGYNFQLENYGLNNALFMSVGGVQPNTLPSGTLTLTTPASFSKLSLLSFSTEFFSVLSVVVNFTDGTSTTANQQTVADWFDGSTAVIAGFGRIKRLLAPPYIVDGMTTNNPRFYPFNINLSCTDQLKLVESITVTEISGGGANSRGVILAVAGAGSTPMSASPVIIPAACGQSNGSASVDITGGNPLISYEWNTTPVQLTKTATNIPAGDYTCTVTDGNLCVIEVPMTVTEKSVVKMKATARPGSICSGSATTLSAIPTGGIIMHYTWTPSNITDSTTSISPTDTTMYVVTGEDFFGCLAIDSIQVSVIQRPSPPAAYPITICPDSIATLSVINPDTLLGYKWYPYPSGGDVAGTGDTFITPPAGETTTWYVEAVTGPCSSDRVPVTISTLERPVTPVVVNTAVTVSTATFAWNSIPGATGYLISINGAPYIAVTDTFYVATGQETITIKVISLGALSCQTSLPGEATAKLKPGEIFIPNAFTPNGDGKNDIFKPEGNIKTLNMKIFNQWGELIAETSTSWNGTSEGKAQPMGVYMYAIKIIMTNGSEVIKKGAVNLLR